MDTLAHMLLAMNIGTVVVLVFLSFRPYPGHVSSTFVVVMLYVASPGIALQIMAQMIIGLVFRRS